MDTKLTEVQVHDLYIGLVLSGSETKLSDSLGSYLETININRKNWIRMENATSFSVDKSKEVIFAYLWLQVPIKQLLHS